jgi:hypothetical protein
VIIDYDKKYEELVIFHNMLIRLRNYNDNNLIFYKFNKKWISKQKKK